jgi:hypothetical protein
MMRSFDQYGNVMLEDTFERHVVGNVYADERVRPCPVSGPTSCVCACLLPPAPGSADGVNECETNAEVLTSFEIRWGCT